MQQRLCRCLKCFGSLCRTALTASVLCAPHFTRFSVCCYMRGTSDCFTAQTASAVPDGGIRWGIRKDSDFLMFHSARAIIGLGTVPNKFLRIFVTVIAWTFGWHALPFCYFFLCYFSFCLLLIISLCLISPFLLRVFLFFIFLIFSVFYFLLSFLLFLYIAFSFSFYSLLTYCFLLSASIHFCSSIFHRIPLLSLHQFVFLTLSLLCLSSSALECKHVPVTSVISYIKLSIKHLCDEKFLNFSA